MKRLNSLANLAQSAAVPADTGSQLSPDIQSIDEIQQSQNRTRAVFARLKALAEEVTCVDSNEKELKEALIVMAKDSASIIVTQHERPPNGCNQIGSVLQLLLLLLLLRDAHWYRFEDAQVWAYVLALFASHNVLAPLFLFRFREAGEGARDRH